MAVKPGDASDIVRVLAVIDQVDHIGRHLLPLLSAEMLELLALWHKLGKPASIFDPEGNERLGRDQINVVAEQLEKICSHAIDIIELAGPVIAKRDEIVAFRQRLSEGALRVN